MAADDTEPRGPEQSTKNVPKETWVKIGAASLLGAVVVGLVPTLDRSGDAPPVGTLLLVGVLLGAIVTRTMYWALTRDLGIPASIAAYAAAFHVPILLVKFVLAPRGIWEVNEAVPFTNFINVGDAWGTLAAAIVVFLLYAGVYLLIYRHSRRGFGALRSRIRDRITKNPRRAVIIAGGTVLVAMAGGGVVLLLPLVAVGGAAQYLEFVFTSGVSLLVAVALAIATAVAGLAFTSVAERAAAVGDVALLVGFFWIGLAFLAMYHLLWVVYILVLTSIWPLKVVVPK